jgi:hypothetical protein
MEVSQVCINIGGFSYLGMPGLHILIVALFLFRTHMYIDIGGNKSL